MNLPNTKYIEQFDVNAAEGYKLEDIAGPASSPNLDNSVTQIKNSQADVTKDPGEKKSLGMIEAEHDAIIAKLLADKHGENLIFNGSRKQWRLFRDGMWIKPEVSEKMIWGCYNNLIIDIYQKKYPDLAIGGEEWLTKSMNQGKRSSVMKDVQTLTKIAAEDMDANSNLIGIQNMVYDIDEKKVRPALASDLVFKSLGTTYDANARCPKWKKFLNTAMQGDKEMIDYLQRLVGYFLTGSTKEQQIYYFYGSGANGKSTFLDLVKAMLGSYGVKLSSDTFMRGRSGATSLSKQTSLSNLEGARLAITDETNDSDVAFDVQSLKSISGDDEITARRMRHNPKTFKSTSKVVMYGNDKPRGNINDEGFWRRFCFIEFGYQVPKEERDGTLLDQLKDEMPGILNWALEGLKKWEKNGLQTPQKVEKESDDYRQELDTVTEFLKDNIAQAPGNIVPLLALFEGYEDWCKNNMKFPETKQAFSKRAKWYFEKHKLGEPHKTNKMRGYKHIRLT